MNHVRTGILLAVLTALFMGVGFLIGGMGGALVALLIAAGMNLFAYWNSDRMVLSMYGAREVDARSAPELHRIVEDLALRAGLPMPRVYIIDDDQPNAFATGRNPENAAVAATSGLLRMCSREEVAGVMAHELAHIRNRDTLIMTVTATIAGAISMLATFALFFGRGNNNPIGLIGLILLMILAPLAAGLVQMAISRTREYGADKAGAEISGDPLALASALRRLQQGSRAIDNPRAEDNPATAHMFIVNPLHARALDGLFATHPKTEDRIARLEAMAREAGSSSYRPTAGRARGPWG